VTLEHALGWHERNWEAFRISLVIDLPPFSWKRARMPVRQGKRAAIILKPEAREWQEAAVAQIRAQWGAVFVDPIPRAIPINAAVVSYLSTRRLTDSSNLYQGPEDVMQACTSRCKPGCTRHAGVYVDDAQIESHEGSRRALDRDNPRVEITLTRAELYTDSAMRHEQPTLGL
jgi:Holliday junction resolvase RusA-like endonuclease